MFRGSRQKKLSAIMKQMAELILSGPADRVSDEAAHVALFLASTAWNNVRSAGSRRLPYRSAIKQMAGNCDIWQDLKSRDPAALIAELEEFAVKTYPGDRREIVTCGTTAQRTIRVEWVERDAPPAGPVAVKGRWRIFRLKAK